MLRVVAGELPEHSAAEALRLRVGRLLGDRRGVVVRDHHPLRRVVEPRHLRLVVPIARHRRHVARREVVVVEDAHLPRARGRPAERLKEAVIRARGAREAASVERHAHVQLRGEDARGEVRRDRSVDVEARRRRVARRSVERGVHRRHRAPGAVEVVGHHVDPVDVRRDAGWLEVGDDRGAGRCGDAEEPARPEGPAERGEEEGVVVPVLRPRRVTGQSATARIFPIDVDPVEPVFLDERGARRRELRARSVGERDVGEFPRPRPAADRNERFHLRMSRLEERELVEASTERARVPGVAGVRLVDVRVRIAERDLSSVGDVGKGVVDMSELVRGDVRYVVVPRVDAPRCEVSDHALVAARRSSAGARGGASGRGASRRSARARSRRAGRGQRSARPRARAARPRRLPGAAGGSLLSACRARPSVGRPRASGGATARRARRRRATCASTRRRRTTCARRRAVRRGCGSLGRARASATGDDEGENRGPGGRERSHDGRSSHRACQRRPPSSSRLLHGCSARSRDRGDHAAIERITVGVESSGNAGHPPRPCPKTTTPAPRSHASA